MQDLLNKRVAALGSWVINGANTVSYDFGVPVEILRVILVYTTGNTTAKNTVTAQRRPVAGTAASQVTLGTFDTTVTTAAGAIDYLDVGIAKTATTATTSGASGISTINYGEDKWTIEPGQDFALVSDGGGTAGVCDVFVEYVYKPWGNRGIGAGTITKLTQAT